LEIAIEDYNIVGVWLHEKIEKRQTELAALKEKMN
jgi:hypothetical protein